MLRRSDAIPPRPVLHQPDQQPGDLTRLPAFPNTAWFPRRAEEEQQAVEAQRRAEKERQATEAQRKAEAARLGTEEQPESFWRSPPVIRSAAVLASLILMSTITYLTIFSENAAGSFQDWINLQSGTTALELIFGNTSTIIMDQLMSIVPSERVSLAASRIDNSRILRAVEKLSRCSVAWVRIPSGTRPVCQNNRFSDQARDRLGADQSSASRGATRGGGADGCRLRQRHWAANGHHRSWLALCGGYRSPHLGLAGGDGTFATAAWPR